MFLTGKMDKGGRNLETPSIISANLKVTGNLVSDGEVHVDGLLLGDIQCETLEIGINGQVKGKIKTKTLRVAGAIEGRVMAGSVFLTSTARIVGDIFHESIAIEPGAFVNGICRHRDEEVELDGEKLLTVSRAGKK